MESIEHSTQEDPERVTFRLPPDKKVLLKVYVATHQTTMQEWLENLVNRELSKSSQFTPA